MACRLTLFKQQIGRYPASIGGNCSIRRLPPISLDAQVLRQAAESVAAHALALEPDLFGLEFRGPAKLSVGRYMAMYLVHVVFGLTHAEVGRMFRRDRTTSARAAAEIEERREDPIFDRTLEQLERALVAMIRRQVIS